MLNPPLHTGHACLIKKLVHCANNGDDTQERAVLHLALAEGVVKQF